MKKNLLFIFLLYCSISLSFSSISSEKSVDPSPDDFGKEAQDFFIIQTADEEHRGGEISIPRNLLRNGRGQCLYADEHYIVLKEKISDTNIAIKQGEQVEAIEKESIGTEHSSFRTGFYDSRTLEPLFYLSFGATQVEFNPTLGVFSLTYDSMEHTRIYRDVECVLVKPDTREWCATSFKSHWLGGNEMSWNGNNLDFRLGWGPMKKTYEIFQFAKPFLKTPVKLRSIDTNQEKDYWEKQEQDEIIKKERYSKIWKESDSSGCPRVDIAQGESLGCIAWTSGTDVLNQLDFNTLSHKAMEMPGKTLASFGRMQENGLWVLSGKKGKTHLLTLFNAEDESCSYECPEGVLVSPSGTEAWSGDYVMDIKLKGMIPKFQAPKNKKIVGVDFVNREVIVQEADKYKNTDDYEAWIEQMRPSSYDLDTGKLKLQKCLWYEVGDTESSSVYNNGCQTGEAPKGWGIGAHHNDYRRMNGLVSSIGIRLPSGKNVFYGGDGEDKNYIPHCSKDGQWNEITANNSVALHTCGKEAKWMLLVYDGSKGGQAVSFDATTLKSREIANWPKGGDSHQNVLWLPEKQWLFVPRQGYYEVIHVDNRGMENAVFSFYYAASEYAIVLPNGLYAGSPGCERLMQYRNETGGLERLARWRNRPGDVLAALGGRTESISLLQETTKRWLHKLRFDPATPEPSEGEMPIAKMKKLPELFAFSSSISVPLMLEATARNIDKYSIKINGVTKTVNLKEAIKTGQNADLDCELELEDGVNLVEIRAIDEKQVVGDAVRFRLIGREISQKKTMYVVSMGVSAYKNSAFNLRYAAKDATDFAEAMKSLYGENIRLLTLTDSSVTRESLQQVRDFLNKGVNPDDSLIFYCAGHGVLDDQWRYVFSSHEFDPDRPSETGILLDDLTACVTSCRARERLLLMDTCHSGMIGEEDEIKLARLDESLLDGVSFTQVRGLKPRKKVQLDVLQQRRFVEEMFALPSSGSEGVTILGAAGGGEFAQESKAWNNGIFTRCLIEGLRDGKADANQDGEIKIGELKKYIAVKVPAMTQGQQKPSLVSYDPDQDFILARTGSTKKENLSRIMDMSDDGINPGDYIDARTNNLGSDEKSDFLRNIFAEKVDYQYIKGKLASRSEIIADIKEGWQRWPHRFYKLLAAGRNENTVEVVYSYSLSDGTGKSAKGYTKEIWTLDDQGKIVQWRETVSRKGIPALSPEILTAINHSGRQYSSREYVECRQNGYVNILAGLFADQVDYQYIKGKMATREDVVKDIAGGFQQWTQKEYNLIASGKKDNVVEVIYSYSVTKIDAPKDQYGSSLPISGYTKETWTLDEQGKIAKWRESISRKEPPLLSQGMSVTFACPH